MSTDPSSRLEELIQRQHRLMDEAARLRDEMTVLKAKLQDEKNSQSGQGDPFACLEKMRSGATPPPPPPAKKSVEDKPQAAPHTEAAKDDAKTKAIAAQLKSDREAAEQARMAERQRLHAETVSSTDGERDVEMELGKVWFVRIGVALLITGLVFFSTYAYQNYILKLSSGGRLAVLFGAAFATMGAGWWCEVKRKLVHFGQVIVGGGMAAVYYLCFAAYHVDKLKVLESPATAAAAMTAWTAVMLGYAAIRKSQIAAVMSVLLAGYAVVINPFGGLALFSALLLAAAAMVMMRRFGWLALGVASLVATYLGFAIWQRLNPSAGEWLETGTLCAYWLVFTVPLFLGKRATAESVEGSLPWLPGTRWQSFFATANNAALFGLLVINVRALGFGGSVIREPFWVYPMTFGVVLLVVMAIAWLRLGWKAPLTQLYLAKGLGLVTLGLMSKLTGYQRHLSLVIESCLLMAAVVFREAGKVVRAAAWIVLGAATVFAIIAFDGESHFAALVFWAASCGFSILAIADARKRKPTMHDGKELKPQTFEELPVIGGIGVMIGGWAYGMAAPWPAIVVMIVVAAVSLIDFGLDRWKELRHPVLVSVHETLVPLVLLIALVMRLTSLNSDGSTTMRIWVTVLAFLVVGLNVFRASLAGKARNTAIAWISTPLVAIHIFMLLKDWLQPNQWMWAIPVVLGIAIMELARYLKMLSTRVSGLLVVILAAGFALCEWMFFGADVSSFAVLSAVASVLFFVERATSKEGRSVERVIVSALVLGIGMMLFQSLYGSLAGLWTGVLGVAIIALGRWLKSEEYLVIGLIGLTVGVLRLCTHGIDLNIPWWASGLGCLLLVGAHQLVGRNVSQADWSKRLQLDKLAPILATAAVVVSMLVLTPQITSRFEGNGHATIWALIGFVAMGLGFLFRERAYRLSALGVIALALGHVLLIDVWDFDTLGRVLSFTALGIAMVLMGFFYNRFQEVLKKVAQE